MDDEERRVFELLRDELVLNEGRIFGEVSATFRWLMATLFAANGGAIIALLSQDFQRPLMLCALALFALGVALSVLMGAVSSFFGYRAISRMNPVRLQIEEGLILGTVPAKAVESLIERQQITWKTWFPSYVGLASFLCFVGGLVAVGIVLIRAV